jgi:hypothetical protein
VINNEDTINNSIFCTSFAGVKANWEARGSRRIRDDEAFTTRNNQCFGPVAAMLYSFFSSTCWDSEFILSTRCPSGWLSYPINNPLHFFGAGLRPARATGRILAQT